MCMYVYMPSVDSFVQNSFGKAESLCVGWNEDEIIGISPYTALTKAGEMKVWKWESEPRRVLSLLGTLAWCGRGVGRDGTHQSFYTKALYWGSSWRGL